MNNFAIGREDGAVAGTVPSSLSVVPRHYAALVGAGRRHSVRSTIIALPNRDLASAEIHYRTVPRLNLIEAANVGLAIASFVEVFWDFADRIID
jgi:hypothetical protein